MPGNARDMITAAERRFPVRVRIGLPPGGLGQREADGEANGAKDPPPRRGDLSGGPY
jgi:hypothetical protein